MSGRKPGDPEGRVPGISVQVLISIIVLVFGVGVWAQMTKGRLDVLERTDMVLMRADSLLVKRVEYIEERRAADADSVKVEVRMNRALLQQILKGVTHK